MTRINLVDAWSAAAVVMMGEGREKQPLAVLETSDCEYSETVDRSDVQIPYKEDLYYPLFESKILAKS
jgi:F420-0:gamma-glutamyl ligase